MLTTDHRCTLLEGKQFQGLVELEALFGGRMARSLLVTTQSKVHAGSPNVTISIVNTVCVCVCVL